MKKRTWLYFIIYGLVLAVNLLVLFCQKNNTDISFHSLPAIILMFLMMIHAASSYILRHKGNYLPFKRFTHLIPFASDKDHTYKAEYLNRFFIMLKVYCLAIPFYIPQIFLTSSYAETLWALVPFFMPQLIYVIMGIADTLSDVKEDKIKKTQSEKERLEQERREAQGKWK